MLQRFTGPDGPRFVMQALEIQPIIGANPELATKLRDSCSIERWEPGAVIMQEGTPHNDICFILSGSASISFQGREVAVRQSGQHVGDMALLNPGLPRSATVMAREEVVIARVAATEFGELTGAHPSLWRNVARTLADRLRQRNEFVKAANLKPTVFIGCSGESLAIADAIKAELNQADANVEVRLWSEGVFKPSTFTLESLERELRQADFAALVLAPDDIVTSREKTEAAPRDNVIFELGLFIGALGHSRTFVIRPHDVDVKMPTDLAGFTTLPYAVGNETEPRDAVASTCAELMEAMRAAGPR